MARTATRAQDARARAREARWALLEARNAQDGRIEEATMAALLALEDRSAAQSKADAAEGAIATALQQLAREKVRIHEMAVLTGLSEAECSRLLRRWANGTGAGATEVAADAAG